MVHRVSVVLALLVTISGLRVDAADSSNRNGVDLFKRNCAQCHEGGDPRAPSPRALYYMNPHGIYKVLTEGAMRPMAQHLSDEDKRQIVEFITQRPLEADTTRPQFQCKPEKHWFDYGQHPLASGWGMTNTQNTRFILAKVANLSKDKLKQLKLKWAFALPFTDTARSQPALAGGAVFVGGQDGDMYALDAQTGCMRWHFKAKDAVRTAVTIADWEGGQRRTETTAPTIYFGDAAANTYAVNAVTGKLRWTTQTEDNPFARLTGSATLQQSKTGNRLYVPVSGLEEGMPINPEYSCCGFRGSVSALNAETGAMIWKTYSIPIAPTERYKNSKGVPQRGPSGAGVWNAPTLDEKRGRLYVGTGENDSSPTMNGGAVLAINLNDGSIAWIMQGYPSEGYNGSCFTQEPVSCPVEFKGRAV
jgi:polyvinyl alcohol dehydrogenase (cytochrome)